jgi:hypothetical protein
MKLNSFYNLVLSLGLILTSSVSFADDAVNFSTIEETRLRELWLNAGFYTYHFQTASGFNNNNLGMGGEYRYSTTSSIVLGEFRNSDWKTSDYAGWYWRPFAFGAVSVGAVFGGIEGYPKMLNGGWFPVAVPVVSFENKFIGANIVCVPSYKDQLHGGLSLQFKIKVF